MTLTHQALFETLREFDLLKTVIRKTPIFEGSRLENSAEHSWHLALAAMLFLGKSDEKLDELKIIKMALIHDIVEIYAGDTFVYDIQGQKDQEEREKKAAAKLFLKEEIPELKNWLEIWEEFEAAESPEAVFLKGLDRLLPILSNTFNDGFSWKKYGIEKDRVLKRNAIIEKSHPELWQDVQKLLDKNVREGKLTE